VELRRNPHYRDVSNVQLERVVYLPTSPATGELNRYRAGEIDITSGVPVDQAEQLQSELPGELRINPALNTGGWAINTRRPPFDNAALRRALAYAIDRELIAVKVFGLGVRPAYTLSALGDSMVKDGSLWQHWSQEERESRAKSLYAEAGYGPGNPLKINLQVLNTGNSPRLANAAAAMWKRVLGAETTLMRYEWKTLGDRLQLGDFEMSIYAYEAHYSEPSTFLRSQLSSTPDPAGYANPDYDALLESARSTIDLKKRAKLYEQAERLLARDMPFIPLIHTDNLQLVQPNVRGYRPSPLAYVYSKDLSIAKSEN
jgi:oligopeptide transport system substrate-binding protein